MQYQYVKAPPKKTSTLTARNFLPFIFIGIGALLIIWVALPILSFRMRFADLYSNNTSVISPLAGTLQTQHVQQQENNSVQGVSDESAASVGAIDYTKAYNWLPTAPQGKTNATVDGYSISVEKLGIKNAFVTIGSDDLSKSLIHYGGTSVPGEYGNAVVFGHSALPQFYNPADYNKIFSTLPMLKEGDEIEVAYDGISYTYVVEAMRVTTPEDVSGLEQRYDDSYLSLVTCVPPGTYKERLWVTTRLKNT